MAQAWRAGLVGFAVLATWGTGGWIGGSATATPFLRAGTVRVVQPVSGALTHILRTAPPAPARSVLHIGLILAPRHPATLAALARAVSTPGSPLFRHFLSRTEVLRRFGPPPDAIDADEAWLRQAGLAHVVRQGWVVYAEGSVAQVNRAFDTSIRAARVGPSTIWAPKTPVAIPQTLADVTWITGLVRVKAPVARPLSLPRPHRLAPAGAAPHVSPNNASVTIAPAMVSPSSVPTGLPATVQLKVTTASGTPATSASVTSLTVVTGNSNAVPDYWTLGPDDQGDLSVTFTATSPGSYTLQATVSPAPGAPAVVATLPTVTFTGSAAAAGPLTPALVNTALDATGVVQGAASHPAAVGLYGDSTPDQADLQAFENLNHITPVSVKMDAVGGYVPAPVNPNGEMTLDLESAAMAAPGSSITAYEVDPNLAWPDGLVEALNAVSSQDAVSVFSISFGSPETTGGVAGLQFQPGDFTAMDTAVEAANVEGITVVAAAGDQGAYTTAGQASLPLQPSLSVPADLPDITAVGGMDFRVDLNGADLATTSWGADEYAALDAHYTETVVNQTSSAANVLGGGGYSAYFPVPSWQAPVLPADATGRGVPDLALPASANFPGIQMQFGGSPGVAGGTSMAAPMFAGYLADMAAQAGKGFGNLNPALYAAVIAHPGIMTQALYGNDGLWNVTAGPWNPLTGLGTPNVDALAAALTAPSPVARLTAAPTGPLAVFARKPVTLTFHAEDAAGRPLPGVPLTFGVTGSLVMADLSTPAAITDAAGNATVTYTDPIGGHAGSVTATAPGVTVQTGTLTIVPPPGRLAFAVAKATAIAGDPIRLGLNVLTATGAVIPLPVTLTVDIGGVQHWQLTRIAVAGRLAPFRLDRAGSYTVTVAIPRTPIKATMPVAILPAAPARFRWVGGPDYVPGQRFREGLAAYDRFGNLDYLIRGTVYWTWRVGGHVYHAATPFVHGVAWGSFVVPRGTTGLLHTSVRPVWHQS